MSIRTLGYCPIFDYPTVQTSGNIEMLQCHSKYNPSLHYAMDSLGNMSYSDYLYCNDDVTQCTCPSVSCIIYRQHGYSAKQQFRLIQITPGINYKIQIQYYVTKRTFNGCCFDSETVEERFEICMSFDTDEATFSLTVSSDGEIQEGEFDPAYFVNKYSGTNRGFQLSRGWAGIIGVCESEI